jgi:hypothetical protein
MRDVNENPVIDHRLNGRVAKRAETFGRLREDEVVEPVGQKRQRGRVGGNLSPEQMRDRDVRYASFCQRPHVLAHSVLVLAELEASLDSVNEHWSAAVDERVQFGRRVSDRHLIAVRRDMILYHL